VLQSIIGHQHICQQWQREYQFEMLDCSAVKFFNEALIEIEAAQPCDEANSQKTIDYRLSIVN
jgi:hypothetical protein